MVKAVLIIAITFFLAMVLMVFPLPGWIVWLRPQWVLMVLIFWLLSSPAAVGLLTAFFLGLFVDLLTATSLGEHALIYVVVSYFVAKYAIRIQLYLLVQRSLVIFLLVFLAQLLEYWLQGLLGLNLGDWRYWLSPVTSAVLWPWTYSILSDIKRRFQVPF